MLSLSAALFDAVTPVHLSEYSKPSGLPSTVPDTSSVAEGAYRDAVVFVRNASPWIQCRLGAGRFAQRVTNCSSRTAAPTSPQRLGGLVR